jgi:transposase
MYYVVMHYTTVKTKTSTGKISHVCELLRESYREGGKVKKRTIANITHLPEETKTAIKYALKNKKEVSKYFSADDIVDTLSVGAIWVLNRMADLVGIVQALGDSKEGKIALWQIIARVMEQGSRLSAARLGRQHAVGSTLMIEEKFTEDNLYQNLDWLSENKEEIEDKLFRYRYGEEKPNLFLYDVTSSYLEGEENEYAAYGYNRDKKKGKKQIVIGLLCDKEGYPVTADIFEGNTSDPKTVYQQIKKVSERFKCKEVTFVGDRGMIKRKQRDALTEEDFRYITAITKREIERLLREDVIQMELFSEDLIEVEYNGERYILRKNPYRAEEIRLNREDKLESIKKHIGEVNKYLEEHDKAKIEVARRRVKEKIGRLNMTSWVTIEDQNRKIELIINEEAKKQESLLDGCYILRTNVSEDIDKKEIHDRYKDLQKVESAFRTCKQNFLEVRPVYVRKASSTKGHILVVMLAYFLVKKLEELWEGEDLTVQEGLNSLKQICALEVSGHNVLYIPKANQNQLKLLKKANVTLPKFLPKVEQKVDSRKKLKK